MWVLHRSKQEVQYTVLTKYTSSKVFKCARSDGGTYKMCSACKHPRPRRVRQCSRCTQVRIRKSRCRVACHLSVYNRWKVLHQDSKWHSWPWERQYVPCWWCHEGERCVSETRTQKYKSAFRNTLEKHTLQRHVSSGVQTLNHLDSLSKRVIKHTPKHTHASTRKHIASLSDKIHFELLISLTVIHTHTYTQNHSCLNTVFCTMIYTVKLFNSILFV